MHQLLGEVLFVTRGSSEANVRVHLALIYDISNDYMLTASPFLHLSLPRRSRFVVESIRSVHQLLGEVLFVARGSSEGNVRVHLALIYIIINDSMLTESPFPHLSLPRRFRFVVESIRSVHQLLGRCFLLPGDRPKPMYVLILC